MNRLSALTTVVASWIDYFTTTVDTTDCADCTKHCDAIAEGDRIHESDKDTSGEDHEEMCRN